MNLKISNEHIESFVGDVKPLWLFGEENLKFKGIKWALSGDAVMMRRCGGCSHGAFNYGVILTFVKAGEATVTASYDGVDYVCRVLCRERKKYTSDDVMNYYLGDFHAHTSHEHIHDKFITLENNVQAEYIKFIKDEALRDVGVITDHSETIDLENFFRGFCEYEKAGEMYPIVYPGSESEIMYEERDRFGHAHRVSGEYIVLNADNFCQAETYSQFFKAFVNSPYAIGIFAHPHIVGVSTSGVWDFRPRYQFTEEFRRLTKYVEVLNYPIGSKNIIHEYAYSDALDAGLRVSTTCGSDLHAEWNFDSYVGKTVIMAPEKTREAITDALLNLRAYACESENVKLRYTVNGMCAPCDLPLASVYEFKVKLGYFKDDKTTHPTVCELISDGGRTLKRIEGEDLSEFSFTVESDTARWFYLRFVDSEGRRTWSPPVFTGREYDDFGKNKLTPIDKSEFRIYDECGVSADALIDDDVHTNWQSEDGTATLTVDMGRVRRVRALGEYAPLIDIQKLRAEKIPEDMPKCSFAVDYVISASVDGENYEICDTGLFRAFAGEDIIEFAPREARYVRLEIKSTAGKRYGIKPYSDAPLKMAEISLFE